MDKALAEAHDKLLVALRIKSELQAAMDRSKAALASNPDDMQARFTLGLAFLALGRLDTAVTKFRDIVRVHPSDGTAHLNLAIAHLSLGQYLNAREETELARKFGVVPPFDLLFLLGLK